MRDALIRRVVLSASLATIGLAISSDALAQATVTGTASYRERIFLPAGAVFEVKIEDVSRADAPAQVIGRLQREPAGQVPIDFEIAYDPDAVIEAHSYSLRARILVDGRLLFTTDQAYPVLTRGAGRELELLLRRVSSQPAVGAAPLEGTTWALTHLGDDPVGRDATATRAELQFLSADGRVAASGGCNTDAKTFGSRGASVWRFAVIVTAADRPPSRPLFPRVGLEIPLSH